MQCDHFICIKDQRLCENFMRTKGRRSSTCENLVRVKYSGFTALTRRRLFRRKPTGSHSKTRFHLYLTQMHLLTTFSHWFEDQLFLFCSIPRKVPEQLPWATCAAGLEPLVCSRAQLSLHQLQHCHWQQHRQWHQPQAKREKDVSRGKQAQLLYDSSPERDEESFGCAAEEGRTQAVVYGRVVAGAARHRRPGAKASLRVRECNCPKVRVSTSFMFCFFFGKEPSWISCITLLRRTLLPWSIVYCHFPIWTVSTGDVRVTLSAKMCLSNFGRQNS